MVNDKKILAVIPARGGSKRLPKKNIIDFNGKPMIVWTIESARKTNLFADIIVSTDDNEIANISKKHGANIHERNKFFDDYSTVSDVVCNVLEENTKNYDIVVMLMANCPIRDDKDIIESVDNFLEKENSFQISCFKYGWMNPWWAHTIDTKQKATPIFDVMTKRSQDLKELYCPTGAIWIAKTEDLLTSKTFYGKGYTMYPINWKKSLDIDDKDDLEMATIMKKFFKDI